MAVLGIYRVLEYKDARELFHLVDMEGLVGSNSFMMTDKSNKLRMSCLSEGHNLSVDPRVFDPKLEQL